jgi:hypothetical protein
MDAGHDEVTKLGWGEGVASVEVNGGVYDVYRKEFLARYFGLPVS